MADNEFLIAGLGNPGPEYALNRHNIGHLVVDALAESFGQQLSNEKWQARYCRFNSGGNRLSLVKPMTYMNRSGQSVADIVRFYKIPMGNVIIIHDDLDMHPGRLKLVKGGGAGGHNGIRSLDQMLGDNSYFRLKFGIGRPGQGAVHPDFPVEKYVLTNFDAQEMKLVNERQDDIFHGLDYFLTTGPARAMSFLNSIK